MRPSVRKRKPKRPRPRLRQYTLRAVPAAIDAELRQRARREHKSLNAVILEALRRGLGPSGGPVVHNDLDFAIGTWVEDPEFDKIIAEQRTVHPDDWK